MTEKDPSAVALGARGGKSRWAGVPFQDRKTHSKKMNEAKKSKKK